MGKKIKRRKFLIDRTFQSAFIVRFCLIVVVASATAGAIILVLSSGSNTVAIENTKVMIKPTSDFIMPILLTTLLIVSACAALAVLMLTLYMSHKIAGPAYRLRCEVDKMRGGDLTPRFTIRENDQLPYLAESMSEMATALRAKQAEVLQRQQDIKNYLEEKNYYINHDERGHLIYLMDQLEETLTFYKV